MQMKYRLVSRSILVCMLIGCIAFVCQGCKQYDSTFHGMLAQQYGIPIKDNAENVLYQKIYDPANAFHFTIYVCYTDPANNFDNIYGNDDIVEKAQLQQEPNPTLENAFNAYFEMATVIQDYKPDLTRPYQWFAERSDDERPIYLIYQKEKVFILGDFFVR